MTAAQHDKLCFEIVCNHKNPNKEQLVLAMLFTSNRLSFKYQTSKKMAVMISHLIHEPVSASGFAIIRLTSLGFENGTDVSWRGEGIYLGVGDHPIHYHYHSTRHDGIIIFK